MRPVQVGPGAFERVEVTVSRDGSCGVVACPAGAGVWGVVGAGVAGEAEVVGGATLPPSPSPSIFMPSTCINQVKHPASI
jgi:hypothetical protein